MALGFKRPLFINGPRVFSRAPKRARVIARRRFPARRKMSRRSGTVNSQRGNFNTNGYSRRRMNRRRYRRIQMDASLVGQHYRSLLASGIVATTSPTNIAQATVNALKMIASSFWTAAGGLQSQDFTAVPTFNDSDLFIRGAKSKITFTNISSSTPVDDLIRVKTWRARTTHNGIFTELVNSPVSAAWDPSHQTATAPPLNVDWHQHYRFFDFQEYLIEPNDTVSREYFIKGHKIDQDLFNEDNMVDFWIYTIQNARDNSGATCNVTVEHNMSFTGDTA